MLLMSRSGTGVGASGWYWSSIGLVISILVFTTLWTFGSLRPRERRTELGEPDSAASETDAADAEDESQTASHDMKGYYWFLIAMAMIVGALTAMQIFALFFIRDKVGLDNPAAGAAALALMIALGAAIAVYPAGKISDRFGRMPVLYGSSIVIAVAAGLLLFVSAIVPLVVLGLFIGIGAAMFLSGGWALITELVPRKNAGRSLGLTAFSTLAGTGLARLSGFGIDALNRQSENLGYDALIIGIVAMLVLSIYPLRQAGIGLTRARAGLS